MITALSTPAAGAVLLDANNTLIKIQSTNGEGYYFRAKIYVDGALFDEQGWSRSDAFTATKDLKKLYSAYFEPAFQEAFSNQLAEQVHLKKMISITIQEYSIDTNAVVQTLTLPSFYILYNTKPAAFADAPGLKVLADNAVPVLPVKGKISLPFYVSQATGPVQVILKSNFGTVIDTRMIINVSGKKVFLYHFDLSGVAFSYSTLWLVAEITAGFTPTQKRVFRINRLPDYPVKEIAYLNNFGFYQYAYFDGELETESGFSVETYETADGSSKVYEINEEATYSINSGSFIADEKAVLNAVALSPDTRLRNGNTWLRLVSRIKKQTDFKDRQHNFSENLQFTVRKGTDVANTGMITVASATPDIEITSVNITGNQVKVYFLLHNGYAPPAITFQWRVSPSGPWYNNTSGPSSPVTVTQASGNFQIRLSDPYSSTPVSDIQNITI